MKSIGSVVILVLVIAVGAVGGVLLARHNAAARGEQQAPAGAVGDRAVALYRAGKYAEALPLLKEWAKTPSVVADRNRLNTVLTYIVTAEGKASGAASQPAVTTQGAVAGSGDVDPSTGKARILHTAIPAGTIPTMGIRELGNFAFDPTGDTPIPADIHVLDGARIRLHGFMIPLTQSENITNFALVPTLANCCFGQPPGVQHTIDCKTEKGKAVEYTVDEVVVEGTLKINVKRDQGYTYSIFEMVVGSVKAAE